MLVCFQVVYGTLPMGSVLLERSSYFQCLAMTVFMPMVL
jgi:hypothetical protein